MNTTLDTVKNLLLSKSDNNIYSWYINNGTLDEVILDKIDFISECIHDGLGDRVLSQDFKKDMEKLENQLNGGHRYGVKNHIYSENFILINGINEMIEANKRSELGFQYVTANQNLRKVIGTQLRKGQQMNFVSEDSNRYFAEDQGASESMLSTQTENGYLHNVATLFDAGRVVSEQNNVFFPSDSTLFQNSGIVVALKTKGKSDKHATVHILIVQGFIFTDSKQKNYRTFHGYIHETGMKDPIYFNGSNDQYYIQPGIQKLSEDSFYGKTSPVRTGLSSFTRIMIKFTGDYGQRLIASAFQIIHAIVNYCLAVSTGDGNMAAYCIKGIKWENHGLIRIPVYYHKRRTIELPGQSVKCRSPGYIILITFIDTNISEESKKKRQDQVHLEKKKIDLQTSINELYKETVGLANLVTTYRDLRTTISHTRRPKTDLIHNFNNIIKELSENMSEVSKKRKIIVLNLKLSSTIKDQLSENDELYESLLKRVNENIESIEREISKKTCDIHKCDEDILKLQREIDKDGSSKAASNFFPKEKWMEGTFHPRQYIDKFGNVVNESQLSTDTELSGSISIDSKNSDYFKGTSISFSPSQSSKTSKKRTSSKTIIGKKRRRGGNKTRKNYKTH